MPNRLSVFRWLPTGLLVGVTLGALAWPVVGGLVQAILGPSEADTELGGLALFVLRGLFGLLAGAIAGRIAGRHEVSVAFLSVLAGVATYRAAAIYLVPREEGIEPVPLLPSLVLFGSSAVLLAALGGFLAARLRGGARSRD